MSVCEFLAYCFDGLEAIPDYDEDRHRQMIVDGLKGTRFRLMEVPEQWRTTNWYIVLATMRLDVTGGFAPDEFIERFQQRILSVQPTAQEMEQVTALLLQLNQGKLFDQFMHRGLRVRAIQYVIDEEVKFLDGLADLEH